MANLPKHKVEVELDLSNYATKFDLKNAAGVYTLWFAKKDDWTNLELEFGKLDNDKLGKVPSSSNNLKSKVNKLDI